MSKFINHYAGHILWILILIGFLFHFLFITWGAPFYFHPDERNITSSISQLRFPNNLNPHFFAYGSLPIYTIFLIGSAFNMVKSCPIPESCFVTFEQAIVIGRIISALLATLLIPLGYFLGKKISGKTVGLLTAFLMTFSVGIIQYSHFMTSEMWTTFFATFQIYLAVLYLKSKSKYIYFFLIIITGLLLSIKVSNAVLLAIPYASLILTILPFWKKSKQLFLYSLLKQTVIFVISCLLILCIFVITNPYVILSSDEFINSMKYESSVAMGTLDVFYTGEFKNSIPLIFQGVKVFPFILNPIVFLTSLISVVYIIVLTIKKRSAIYALILCSFFLLFLSQAFLYVKWVRYMIPTLPFFYLFTALALSKLLDLRKKKHHQMYASLLLLAVLFSCVIFSYSFFHTVYLEQDTRLHARDFAIHTIPKNARILTEVYDMGIVPFNDSFNNISLFNVYDLDYQGSHMQTELDNSLTSSEYIILPSQRVLATRKNNPQKFPVGASFYNDLLTKKTYVKIYETPCSFFCQITYLGNPISQFEGTANVFDRPHITIIKIQ